MTQALRAAADSSVSVALASDPARDVYTRGIASRAVSSSSTVPTLGSAVIASVPEVPAGSAESPDTAEALSSDPNVVCAQSSEPSSPLLVWLEDVYTGADGTHAKSAGVPPKSTSGSLVPTANERADATTGTSDSRTTV